MPLCPQCQMLQKLLIQYQAPDFLEDDSTSWIDFSTMPWSDAALIMPQHAIQTHWNKAALHKMCINSQQWLFICTADDTIKGKPLLLAQCFTLVSQHKTNKRQKQKDLPESIHLVIRMKVMVMNNLQTNLNIKNGAQGVITDIILDPNEPTFREN
jgi:hypothetical protein